MIVLIINALNLIDGIDGLAASMGIISTLFFGVWFFLSGDYGYTILAASLLGALIVFLFYNISNGPKKIFMGDTGSLVIGFTLAVLAIRFNEFVASGRSVVAWSLPCGIDSRTCLSHCMTPSGLLCSGSQSSELFRRRQPAYSPHDASCRTDSPQGYTLHFTV
ncbi:MAG: undecaprenyl/decaprenyl-phosphate alpha-N-acetylglucosaminyl 1-phosphate transferase [Bacteroidales bacterium]|nr:undecaprenyl/decaprenyl-phosphate alpha-N-acetylglucosaminyl 1-phosphate transferase [Bacteroidales bacterium]